MNKINSNYLSYLFLLIGLLTCVFIGKVITVLPLTIPLYILGGGLLFFIGFFKPDFALILMIFAMLLSPEISIAKVPTRDVIIRIEDLFVIVFSMAWISRLAIMKTSKVFIPTPLNKLILLFSFFLTISTLRGMLLNFVVPLQGAFYLLKILEYFLIFFFTCSLLKSKQQVESFLKALFVVFIIVNVYAIFQIGHFSRVSAPFEGQGEPNTLGGYLVLMQGILLGLITHIHSGRLRWILAGLGLVSMVTLAYTLSRASYVAFIPMYLTVIFYNKTRKRHLLIGTLMVAIILGFFFFPQNVSNRIKDTFIPQVQETIAPVEIGSVTLGPSASARIRSWMYLFSIWQKEPFLGYGMTGVGFVDSQYVRILAETGALGLITFLGLMIVIFMCALRIYKTTNDNVLKGIALGFLAGHIGMLVHALTANTFIIIRIMEPYWFLTAIVMMIPKFDEKIEPKKSVSNTGKGEYLRAVNFLVTTNKISY